LRDYGAQLASTLFSGRPVLRLIDQRSARDPGWSANAHKDYGSHFAFFTILKFPFIVLQQ